MKRLRMLAALVLAVALPAIARAAPAAEHALAVVIGSNESPTPALERLRYADDDAIQNARMLSLLGVRSQLLVSPDAETRELFPSVPADGRATRASVVAAFDRSAALARQARARGQATSLYIFVAAHGDVEGDRAFLQLEDGRLWREDLAELARRVGADQTHVVIDACQASVFVGSRGPGGDRFPLGFGFSREARSPSWPPRTGFLTARSSGGQTHEWTEFQAGIFSHEVRSGLLGGADVDRDGRVTYAELGAFIRRANELIPNRKYRPEVLTAPPGGALEAVVATLPAGPLLLDIEGKAAGRASVETERGVRLADVHVAPGGAVSLRLPTDLGAVFVARGTPARRVPGGAGAGPGGAVAAVARAAPGPGPRRRPRGVPPAVRPAVRRRSGGGVPRRRRPGGRAARTGAAAFGAAHGWLDRRRRRRRRPGDRRRLAAVRPAAVTGREQQHGPDRPGARRPQPAHRQPQPAGGRSPAARVRPCWASASACCSGRAASERTSGVQASDSAPVQYAGLPKLGC